MSASVRSRRAWGWHPLTDEWAVRIVADAAVRPGELVLDIGAGHGALTAAGSRARKILRRRVYQDGGGPLRLYRLRQRVLEPAR